MLKKVVPMSPTLSSRLAGKTSSSQTKTPFGKQLVIEELCNREIVQVKGEEALAFMQGLITNDMNHLIDSRSNVHGVPSMYAMFLNKAGRMLYDTIIYRPREPNTFLIECDKAVSSELRRHLRVYRVRRNIDIDAIDDVYKPWIIFDPVSNVNGAVISKRLGADSIYTPDPRIRGLGWRLLTAPERSWGDVARAFAIPSEVSVVAGSNECNYRYHRYRYGVGEGILDLPPAKCLPLEINGDFLHGISFQKGCYVGQELTARVFHTGVIRKRLMPVRLTANVSEDVKTVSSDISDNLGTIRGVCNDRALALLRVEPVLKASHLTVGGEPCFVEKPKWWPTELPNKVNLADRA